MSRVPGQEGAAGFPGQVVWVVDPEKMALYQNIEALNYTILQLKEEIQALELSLEKAQQVAAEERARSAKNLDGVLKTQRKVYSKLEERCVVLQNDLERSDRERKLLAAACGERDGVISELRKENLALKAEILAWDLIESRTERQAKAAAPGEQAAGSRQEGGLFHSAGRRGRDGGGSSRGRRPHHTTDSDQASGPGPGPRRT